jgi:hypothetical protein
MKRGMRNGIVALTFIILLSSFISAEILFTQPLEPIYNLGDTVVTPVIIKAVNEISGAFKINLLCNGTEINLLTWSGMNLKSGYEQSIPYSFGLVTNTIGSSKGRCVIKAILNSENALTEEFEISDILSISAILQKSVVDSGEVIPLKGKVTKKTGENANGFVDTVIVTNDVNQQITQSGTIDKGDFAMNISIPSTLKAGEYYLTLNVYEKDSNGLITNSGTSQYNISVNQVPTNLELVIIKEELNPSETLAINAILHDQTGEQINSSTFITIKDSTDKIIEQREIEAGTFFEYLIAHNEPPAEWKIFATSDKITSEETFIIKAKESVEIQIINKTILVTNNGNVAYNKTLLVKIGESPLNVKVSLDIGESKKYSLTAPDGEYTVKIIGDDDNEVTGTMSLTGNAVGIKESSWSSFGVVVLWILLISALSMGTFFAFKKVRQKPFFAHWSFGKKDNKKEVPILKNNSIEKTSNKAEMSLSIKGEKQDANIICLKIKNLQNTAKKSSVSDTVKKITEMAEEKNAVIYENQDYLFFILAPTKTRTFKNEKLALELTGEMQRMIVEHNRMFNQKIEYGISLNYGTIIAKMENGTFKFMSLDSLMTVAKKIASLSNEEILLSSKMNDLVRVNTRAEKDIRDGTAVFILTNVKKEDDEAKRFINKFLNRQDKE